MQRRIFKVFVWPFKGKWAWNVTNRADTVTLAQGGGLPSRDQAYRTGKKWLENYRRELKGEL